MSEEIFSRLTLAGMSDAAAQAKAEIFDQAERRLLAICGDSRKEIQRVYVPGRIEVLGKHTDYAGGLSLLCAAERGICIAFSARDDSTLRISDFIGNREAELSLASCESPGNRWLAYVTTVMRRVVQNFPGEIRGADVALGSDLPRAAGMSSSSALVIAIFSVLEAVNHLADREEHKRNIQSREDLATYLACIENGQSFGTLAGDSGVGTHGGSEDHIAILCCAAKTLTEYQFCPARRVRDIAFDDDLEFVIAVSGIAADKTGSAKDAYNRASRAAGTVLQIWRETAGREDATLFAAVTSSANAVDRMRQAVKQSAANDFSTETLLDRLEQFRLETVEIIPAASAAFGNRDWKLFGELVDRSQFAAESLLKNQIAETVALASSARRLGAIASSSFGAGFGGSVWALIPSSDSGRFANEWAETYRREFPVASAASMFFVSRPGPAMLAL